MSAEIPLFTGVQRAPAVSQFAPGQPVIIACYTWDRGETQVSATVVRQEGKWVHVRIPEIGHYSVHVSVVHALEPEVA